jgi:hypothetical protein
MFAIITNYKKMFSSFIKNEFGAGLTTSPAASSTPITVDDFKGVDSKGLRALQKILTDKRIDPEEARIMKIALDLGHIT